MNVRIDPTTLAALAGDLERPDDELANAKPARRNRNRHRASGSRPRRSLRWGR